MKYSHPYSRYGLALVMVNEGLKDMESVSNRHLQKALIENLNHFRLKPAEIYEGVEKVKFDYVSKSFIEKNKEYQTKGNTDIGIFLAPNIITSDFQAGKAWQGVSALIKKLDQESTSSQNLTMSLSAISAKFNNGKKSQSTPKVSLQEVACAAITNTTPYKPCLTYKHFEKGRWNRENTAIIPDLPLEKMIKFILLFKRMLTTNLGDDLWVGRVSSAETGKGEKKKTVYTPWRPQIFNGNFPFPPRSSALGSLALLGAIGKWSEEAENWADGQEVLDHLVDVPIYMVSYGKAKTFTYHHHIIELAKNHKLSSIIDSIHYTQLFNTESRTQNKSEYQTFDLFSSRFFQLFNRPAFKDFLAHRAEYPYQLEILLTTYLTKMENIPTNTVKSARELGKWLNRVAYLTAKKEFPNTKDPKFKEAKAKVLVEIESAAFSAKSGDALIFQVVTRAGRLSQEDAPPESALFVEQTCSGELPLERAKNLLIAFSRLRTKYEKTKNPTDETVERETEDTTDHEELETSTLIKK